jgi:HAD superfamily hydrolase (TIGR01509 family)
MDLQTTTSDRRILVFDVGKVLVDFCFEDFKQYLASLGASIASTEDFFQKTRIHDYEKGLIDCDEFFSNILACVQENPSRAEIETRWKDIFTPKEEMFGLLKNISQSRRTFLLSNTNKSHWDYLEESYQLSSYVEGLVTSFEAQSMKPDTKIYHRLVEKYDLVPTEIVFIDDLSQNTNAARELGWEAIHHTSINATRSQLESLKII